MSLGRHFFNEFRPLFRMLEEPLLRGRPVYGLQRQNPFRAFDEAFDSALTRPAIDLTEDGKYYVVEAEIPGVKKENVEVRIGDNGQSLTIEGKTFIGSQVKTLPAAEEVPKVEGTSEQTAQSQVVAPPEEGMPNPNIPDDELETDNCLLGAQTSNAITNERNFSGSSSFSRTIWLPRPVDASGVSAKLVDGVLSLRIPKAEEHGATKINID